MIDGCQLRFRGPGWGQTRPTQPRVAWHELKLGVFHREEQAAQTAGRRGILSGKRLVIWRGELGRRPHWEAQAEGWAGRPACAASTTARRGSGTSCRTAGARPGRCSTSTTPASTCGRWEPRCTGMMKPPAVLGQDCAAATRPACWASWGAAAAGRSGRGRGAPRTELPGRTRPPDALPGTGGERPDRQRRGGIGLPPAPVPLQTRRPVLDQGRLAPPLRPPRSTL